MGKLSSMADAIEVFVTYVDINGDIMDFPRETSLTTPVIGQGVVRGDGSFFRVKDVWEVHTKPTTSELSGLYAVLVPVENSEVPPWLFRGVRGEEPPSEYAYSG